MQKRVTENGIDYLLISVPQDGFNWQLLGGTKADALGFTRMPLPGRFKGLEISIPSADYTLIGKGDSISEDQWKGIVDAPLTDGGEYEDGEKYMRYGHSQNDWPYIYETATESGHSWIRSNGFEPNKVVILKIN